tara:strand:- start:34390 stop:35127 length:738 start_codon:yes stop_codon:yes gene_type:complete
MYIFIYNLQKIYINFLKKLSNTYYKHKNYLKQSPNDVYSRFEDDEKSESYDYFKKYFYTSIFVSDEKIREYSIKKSLELNKDLEKNDDIYYLEFGVHKGISINYFSKFVKKIHGFDSFKGLTEDWLGFYRSQGSFNLNGKAPFLKKNVEIHIGLVQETLQPFLDEHNPCIGFVHMDLDTYPSTKFVLEKLKPFLAKDSIILFDQLYNYSGWKNGELKALEEVFNAEDFAYLAFSKDGKRVCVKIV